MSDEAWIYDLSSRHITEDLSFWLGLIREYRPKYVLELGCRTGRISFPVVTTGLSVRSDFQLLGLDCSAAMLDRARARHLSSYPSTAPALRFIQGAVSGFTLRDRFDLVIFPASGLETLIESDLQRSCLRTIRRHLADGGLLAFDIRVPCLECLADAQHGSVPVVRQVQDRMGPAPGVARLTSFSKTIGYDAATQTEATSQSLEIYYSDGRHQSLVSDTTSHRYFPGELRNLLSLAGFAPLAEYGSYDRIPFSAASRRYLWISAAV